MEDEGLQLSARTLKLSMKQPSQMAVVSAAVAMSAVALFTDLFTTAEYCPPILYVIALALCIWARDYRVIWAIAVPAVVLTFVGGLFCYPPTNAYSRTTEFWINRVFVALALVCLTFILHGYNRLAAAYRQRREELVAANRELDTARQRAEDTSARKTRFMAAVSHDVRSPASAIRILAHLIRQARTDPARVEDLTLRLESSAAALTELLTDALDVAKFDSEMLMALTETDVELSVILNEAARVVQPLAETKGLRMTVQDDAGGLVLRADRQRLARVLVNLLDNAIKFTDTGMVSLHAAMADSGGVRIDVRDTGRGIDGEHFARIFDEFFQVRRADRDRSAGRGLGLATCKRLVEAMDGRIDVESHVGRGTVFTIQFPGSRVVSGTGEPSAVGSHRTDVRPCAT